MHYSRGGLWAAHSLPIQTGQGAGATVTPGNNTYGAVATLITAGNNVGGACRSILNLNSTAQAGQNKQCIAELVYDSTGSANWVPLVSHLQAAHLAAGNTFSIKGIDYDIPLRIPAGVAIGVRASINNATVGTLKASISLLGRPDEGEKYATFSETLGAVTATSKGTDITPGNNALSTIAGNNGTWVDLGATSRDLWAWDFALGQNQAHAASDFEMYGDLAFGDASNKTLLLEHSRFVFNASSMIMRTKVGDVRRRHAPRGSNIYARLVTTGTYTPNVNVIAYGYGGGNL